MLGVRLQQSGFMPGTLTSISRKDRTARITLQNIRYPMNIVEVCGTTAPISSRVTTRPSLNPPTMPLQPTGAVNGVCRLKKSGRNCIKTATAYGLKIITAQA